MWIEIGPEKEALLKSYSFEIVGMGFIRCGKIETWTLTFEHVSDKPLAELSAELRDEMNRRRRATHLR